MPDKVLFVLLLAMTVAAVGALGVQIMFALLESKRRALQQRLGGEQPQARSAYAPIILDEEKAKKKGLRRVAVLKGFRRQLYLAYPDLLLGRFLLLVGLLALFSFSAGAVALKSILIGVIAAALAVVIPFMRVTAKCRKRLKIIDEQLPDTLDFLARILRAGHSLTTGFQMAGEELPDPLASELQLCYDQHSLGAPLENAMRDMAERVGTSDFAFFVTAVLIQRQTGGDLAEVLANISGMIRARLRLASHVKAITAQGRLVGTILLVLPVVFFLILYFMQPQYMGVLLHDRAGLTTLGVAVMMQAMGILWIKRIVAVRM